MPTFYQKNEYSEAKSLLPVRSLMTWLLSFVCLFLYSAKVQGQSLENKTPSELTKILAQFLRVKQTRYDGIDGRKDMSKRASIKRVVLYFCNTIKSVQDTTLIGYRVDTYHTTQEAKLKQNGELFCQWIDSIDLKKVRNSYVRGREEFFGLGASSGAVVYADSPPVKTRNIEAGRTFEQTHTTILFILPSRKDAEYVKRIIDAISGQKQMAKNNPPKPNPAKTLPPAPNFGHHNNKQVATKFDPKEWTEIKSLEASTDDIIRFNQKYQFKSGSQIAVEMSSDASLPVVQFYFTARATPLNADGTIQPSIATPEWYDPVEYSAFTGTSVTPRRVLEAAPGASIYEWTITIPGQEAASIGTVTDAVSASYIKVRIYVRKAK